MSIMRSAKREAHRKERKKQMAKDKLKNPLDQGNVNDAMRMADERAAAGPSEVAEAEYGEAGPAPGDSGGPPTVADIFADPEPALYVVFELFYQDKPPYRGYKLYSGIGDINTRNRLNAVVNLIKMEYPDAVRVLLTNWKVLQG